MYYTRATTCILSTHNKIKVHQFSNKSLIERFNSASISFTIWLSTDHYQGKHKSENRCKFTYYLLPVISLFNTFEGMLNDNNCFII